jgi:hypothetical protein
MTLPALMLEPVRRDRILALRLPVRDRTQTGRANTAADTADSNGPVAWGYALTGTLRTARW